MEWIEVVQEGMATRGLVERDWDDRMRWREGISGIGT